MFPESVRDVTWTISTSSVSGVQKLYSFSRAAMWIIATSAIILAAPALIENEKAQIEELSRQQQRQVRFGLPNCSSTLQFISVLSSRVDSFRPWCFNARRS